MSQELSAHSWVKNESSGQSSVLLAVKEGAPLRRSPRGLFTSLCTWVRSPEVRVWARPLARIAGIMGVLGAVAFLGKLSEEESFYGGRMTLPASAAAPVSAADSRSSQERQTEEVPEPHQDTGGPGFAFAQAASTAPAPPPCAAKQEAGSSSGVLPDGRIIMNEATQGEFTRLPGVGEARAAKIIELRTRMGKFRQVADLMRVRGIGFKTLESMKDQLVVDRPVEKEAPSEGEGEKPSNDSPASKPSSS